MVDLGTGATEEGHLNIGYILRAERRYGEALERANDALALDPDYDAALELRDDLVKLKELLG